MKPVPIDDAAHQAARNAYRSWLATRPDLIANQEAQ